MVYLVYSIPEKFNQRTAFLTDIPYWIFYLDKFTLLSVDYADATVILFDLLIPLRNTYVSVILLCYCYC